VLDVVSLAPGTNTPQANPRHTYIEVGRSGDEDKMSFFGILGPASDQVCILRQGDEVNILHDQGTESDNPSTRIATLSWEIALPNLLDVFSAITLLSVTFPTYNILTRQCCWFARAIYDVLRYAYDPVIENTGDEFWKREKFYIFVRLLTHDPLSVQPPLRGFRILDQVWSGDHLETPSQPFSVLLPPGSGVTRRRRRGLGGSLFDDGRVQG
jgi:hypothetical protein